MFRIFVFDWRAAVLYVFVHLNMCRLSRHEQPNDQRDDKQYDHDLRVGVEKKQNAQRGKSQDH